MKTSSAVIHSAKPKEQDDPRSAFFERCFISLLSSAMSQFEVRDRDGTLQLLYDHPRLAKLSEKAEAAFEIGNKLSGSARQEALQKSIDAQADLTGQMFEADEQIRIEMLVDRCYRMAEQASSRYFDQQDFADFASQC